ncbi:helix-turn-helix domain-containing protein [Pectobacterium parmentieri]|uniref:helix-turn-helix domain-containing protein n=1 Tax=Pectobacterium parmentieri TaxID=1905730 RepID=UPI000CDE3810|nr:helix-turn-helix domain-containing protein [Pectobacterium parmentieri]AYH04316.1 helix-turn-helix domain-containing protein [Pectobacterium parmentieri]AYH13138.1 helix-turn-helix domain-containing protein [Pectobacterium parmentieri]AYH21840.1 helix-turn-helix domain-containing protein [Pectobacterium parmentieri]MBN3178608.1 helix-turn-helix domain-containing protein [Pectobacterium parmentieri]POW24129.1 transcriptional regulator [Pectobacterium parmentieri]
MMYADAIKAANNLTSIVPLLGGSTSCKDYEDAPEFVAFNERIKALPAGIALLRILMDQHGLTQSDFEAEIGKKSLVSRILNGERTLTVDHMSALAKRFDIPVSAFVD